MKGLAVDDSDEVRGGDEVGGGDEVVADDDDTIALVHPIFGL